MSFAFSISRASTGLLKPALPQHASCSFARARAFTSSPALLKYKATRRPRDLEIEARTVQVVDPEGGLQPPEPLQGLLDRIKARTHFVELVQQNPPIVKIVSRSDDLAARKAAKVKQRASKMERKEIQMTWNVAESDIAHKLKKAREELMDGNLVDVAIAPKSRQPLPKPQEMEDRLELIVEKLSDVGVERQARSLVKGVGAVFFRPDRAKLNNQGS